MTQAELKVLLNKYTEGTLSREEQSRLDQWYLYQARNGESLTDAAIYEKRMRELNEALFPDHDEEPKRIKLWPRIAVAAAAVAAITLGTWLYVNEIASSRKASRNDEVVVNDIAPGKNTATLTLADGKIIALDTNKSSVVVTDSVKTMTMLTASTPRGGTYQVTLPDGTKVWLNADSKISFPSQFNRKERKILLEGEAYFEVAKVYTPSRQSAMSSSRQSAATGDLMPFIVESAGQQVEVLGTHFNVNAYGDELEVKTTLLEGSVRVSTPSSRTGGRDLSSGEKDLSYGRDDGETVLLKPNQQSIITSSSARIQVKEVEVNDVIDWKNGDFILKGETLEAVMRKISRWYIVDVSYTEDAPRNLKLGGYVSRSRNISAVLDLIERTGEVKFKIQGNIVQVVKQ